MTISLHTLGQQKTNPADGLVLSDIIDNLASLETELLSFVAEELKEEDDSNEKGIYISHGVHNSKPFDTKALDGLIGFGIITLHHSSGNGNAYVHCNEDVYDLLVEFGDILEY